MNQSKQSFYEVKSFYSTRKTPDHQDFPVTPAQSTRPENLAPARKQDAITKGVHRMSVDSACCRKLNFGASDDAMEDDGKWGAEYTDE